MYISICVVHNTPVKKHWTIAIISSRFSRSLFQQIDYLRLLFFFSCVTLPIITLCPKDADAFHPHPHPQTPMNTIYEHSELSFNPFSFFLSTPFRETSLFEASCLACASFPRSLAPCWMLVMGGHHLVLVAASPAAVVPVVQQEIHSMNLAMACPEIQLRCHLQRHHWLQH